MRWFRNWLVGLLMVVVWMGLGSGIVAAEDGGVTVHLFGSKSCPHCGAEGEYLGELVAKYDWLSADYYEVSDPRNVELLERVADELNVVVNAVPVAIVGEEHWVGFGETRDFKRYVEEVVLGVREEGGRDVVGEIVAGGAGVPIEIVGEEKGGEVEGVDGGEASLESVQVWGLGEVALKDLSLPVLTFVIALLDGFNPCAMWVLLFLISLLLGMENRMRMWSLGGVFIVASGLMYFMFLTAWLNLFLFLGFIAWVRMGIGVAALAIGGYYLWDYQRNKAAVCKVMGDKKRRKTFERLKLVTQKRSFWMALVGMVMLAFAVNVVELVCSAGLPAVYTQVLAMTAMPRWQHYLYLLFYIVVFMLDDMIVFGVAMTTLHAVGVSGKYARFSHLIGGLVMLLIGALMILKPEWLMFG